jgi:tetratricopeptide (TPR) repeat protein
VLIAVDDAQWIDKSSGALLGFVASRTAPGVTLVVAWRSGDQEPALSLPDTTISVDLPPLTHSDIIELSDEPAAVIASTGGVPLLITEYLAGTRERSEIDRYIETRLSAVGDLARQVLTTASILTGSCDVPLLRDVSGRSEDEVVEAVEELLEAGLLREISEIPELEFTLDALERVVYESLKLVRRRLLHRRAGETLAQRPRAHTDTRLAAATATQFRGAGDDRAAEWYATAGALARLEYAHEEARTFYESAIALGSTEAAFHHLALGEIAITTGDYRQAITELTAAAARADGELIAKVEHRLGEVNRLLGRFEAARIHFERSVSLDDHVADTWGDWAMLEYRLGDEARSLELAKKSLAAAIAEGARPGLGRANSILGVVTRDRAEAMDYLETALQLSDGNDLARMAALNNKAHLLAEIGNGDTARELVEEAIEIADRTGHRHREASLRNHLADLLYRAGRLAEAEEQQRRAAGLFASVGTEGWEPEVWLLSRW